MTDAEIAELAAERWGLSAPSMDDVISEHTPDYQTNPMHRLRWHNIKDMVLELLGAERGRCWYCSEWCGENKRYCNDECADAAMKVPRYCAVPECRALLEQKDGEPRGNFLLRKTCGFKCGGKLASMAPR